MDLFAVINFATPFVIGAGIAPPVSLPYVWQTLDGAKFYALKTTA